MRSGRMGQMEGDWDWEVDWEGGKAFQERVEGVKHMSLQGLRTSSSSNSCAMGVGEEWFGVGFGLWSCLTLTSRGLKLGLDKGVR